MNLLASARNQGAGVYDVPRGARSVLRPSTKGRGERCMVSANFYIALLSKSV